VARGAAAVCNAAAATGLHAVVRRTAAAVDIAIGSACGSNSNDVQGSGGGTWDCSGGMWDSSGGMRDSGGGAWDSGGGARDSGGGMWDSSVVTLPCNSSTPKYILISLMTTSVWLDEYLMSP
jgi:hypothetical protein